MNFKALPMPMQAQLSPFRTEQSLMQIMIIFGYFIRRNYYDNNIQMGRYDADYGTLLLNKGNDKFVASTLNGLAVKGQIRCIKPVKISDFKQAFVLARNNDSAMVINFKNQTNR